MPFCISKISLRFFIKSLTHERPGQQRLLFGKVIILIRAKCFGPAWVNMYTFNTNNNIGAMELKVKYEISCKQLTKLKSSKFVFTFALLSPMYIIYTSHKNNCRAK